MKFYQSLFILASAFLLINMTSCKQDKKDGPKLKPEGVISPNTPDLEIYTNFSLTFITKGFLRKWSESKDGAARNEQEVQEEWIDFAEDGTYETGRLNEVTGYGIWNYNPGNSRIHMTADDKEETKSEFRVSRGEERLVFMGTETYDNEDVFILFNRMYDQIPKPATQ